MAPPKRNHLIEATLADLEEMKHFPSEEARRQAIQEHIKAVSHPRALIYGIVVLVAVAVAANFTLRRAASYLPASLPRQTRPVLVIGGTIVAYWLTLRALHRLGTPAEMRRRLIRLGVPICLKCGYLLRGLTPQTPACPECGRAIPAPTRDLLAKETVTNP